MSSAHTLAKLRKVEKKREEEACCSSSSGGLRKVLFGVVESTGETVERLGTCPNTQ